ncbi:FliM/FliN family flagellar motor switch protein [Hyphococcus sp.]|uniref:FliM/FliN family flagellar motor switch protein n=1 Tax=Hyphococcus sp. TaxID=2038636 RepID=UPI0035C76300
MSDENQVVEADPSDDEIVADVLNGGDGGAGNRNILELPVRVVVSIGSAKITVQKLLELTQETVIDLEQLIDDPVDIFVGDRLIAKGELVEATDNENGIGVKLLEIVRIGN